MHCFFYEVNFFYGDKKHIRGVNINRKFIYLSVFLLFLLSVSSVSAEDNLSDIGYDQSFNIDSSIKLNESVDMNADNSFYGEKEVLYDENDFDKDKNLNKLSSSNLKANFISDSDSSSDLSSDSGLDSGSDLSSDSGLDSGSDLSSDSDSVYDSGSGITGEENIPSIKNTYLSLVSAQNWKISGTGEDYLVKLSDEDGNPVPYEIIYFEAKSSSETLYFDAETDSEGIASISLELYYPGAYSIASYFEGDDEFNSSNNLTSKVYVYKTSQIKLAKSYGYRGENISIKLYGNGALLKNKNVTVVVGDKKYVKTTNSSGMVAVKLPNNVSRISISCSFAGSGYYYGSTLSQNIPVYKRTFTKNNVYSLLKGSTFRVTLKGTDGKILSGQNVTFDIYGKIYVKKTNSKGVASLKINLQRGEYRISYSFGNNGIYGPSSNHTDLNVINPAGQYKKLLNVKTSASVKKYLSGGGYATITKSIRNLAKSLTKKYNNNFDKAVAIFNYVRDTLDYEYYYNTRKGAAKTLKTKAGNCCDHANLIVALCRAAKIPARYSNSKYCVFSSGRHTGHVWAQIYVGGTWYSADATSSRNTLGHIANWNTKTNKYNYNFRNLPF